MTSISVLNGGQQLTNVIGVNMSTLRDQAKEIGVSMCSFVNWIKKNNPKINQKGNKKWLGEEDFQKAKSVLGDEKAIRVKTEELKKRGLRECRECKKEDKIENFRPTENLCNDCYKERMNNYYNDNKEVLLGKQKTYYQKNKEQQRNSAQRWRDNNRELHRNSRNDYQRRNKEKRKLWHRKYKYGITEEQYEKMLKECDEKCNICQKEMNVICIDHDHDTGFVRHLLCRDCNYALGDFEDNVEYIYRAIKYLLEYHSKECYRHKYTSGAQICRNREFYLLLFENSNCCEICGKTSEDAVLHIDHDHFNNRIRGLLCSYCNHAIGHCNDSVAILGNAIAYLEEHL